jgi:hypothetical protein
MKKYSVVLSIDSKIDIANLKRYIKQELKAPDTAANYIKGLKTIIQKLSVYAGSVGANEYVQGMFGVNVRHVTFKKMAIVYFIEDDVAYIQRIIAMSLIH